MRLRNIAIFSAVMLAAAIAGSLVGPRPAQAVAREIVELQRDVTSLLQGQRDLSTQMTQDHTIMKTLVEQTNDNVGKLNGTISSMQKSVQDVQANWAGPDMNMHHALLFNRRLWTIFLSAAETNDNPQPLEIRQNIANIGVFVMKQTIEMQMNPDPAKLKSLIDINCNLAAGLSGRV